MNVWGKCLQTFIPTNKKMKIQARINNEDEYRYRGIAENWKIIVSSTQWYNSREAMERNMEKRWIDPDQLPDRITRAMNPNKGK